MNVSNRTKNINPSVTLKLNETASRLAEQGKKIFNLTAGQLPEKPPGGFVESVKDQLGALKSYQYSPVKGLATLNEKFMTEIERKRNIVLPRDKFSSIISCGAKHSVFNALGALVNPNDEVIMLTPYWVSYPEMINVWQGKFKVLHGQHHKNYQPDLDGLEELISDKTKVVILNSPNNPGGVHYSEDWMKSFATIMCKYPNVFILSDEIYFDLSYFDPGPTYFYQYEKELLDRTIIVDGISKSFAGTGLRIGYCIARNEVVSAISKLQSHSTSGANSLVQQALANYDSASELETFLKPVKLHLKRNALKVQEKLDQYHMSAAWYQCHSAFYFLLNFTFSPYFKNNFTTDEDHAVKICEAILESTGVAIVPSSDFGVHNSARISLVSEEHVFDEAIDLCFKFLSS